VVKALKSRKRKSKIFRLYIQIYNYYKKIWVANVWQHILLKVIDFG